MKFIKIILMINIIFRKQQYYDTKTMNLISLLKKKKVVLFIIINILINYI